MGRHRIEKIGLFAQITNRSYATGVSKSPASFGHPFVDSLPVCSRMRTSPSTTKRNLITTNRGTGGAPASALTVLHYPGEQFQTELLHFGNARTEICRIQLRQV